MLNQLIINTEYFLGCAGSCAGCFLSQTERSSKTNYHEIIKRNLLQLLEKEFIKEKKGQDFLVIGFGRGNNLALDETNLSLLGELIQEIQDKYHSQKIVFEVSTSLIGKIQPQIENAKFLLNYSKNIYFNIVVNSEITSNQFWTNLNTFHESLTAQREHWGWTDNTSDILVLNVNPALLPNINKLREFSQSIHSPINISLFPFESDITEQKLTDLKVWTQQVSVMFKDKDLNIKNHLSQYSFDLSDFSSVVEHIEKTKSRYYFIDKDGLITNGIPSIMGEIDFPRLLEKYNLKPNVQSAFKTMQKHLACKKCNHQMKCLVTGSYLNMLANNQQISICPSGYHEFFENFSGLN